ncbi:hypothetical protein SFRURICE_006632 [Spodoptera frugiperda]|nr:hypothetical protein SFRURICE_006632 [Spodoptera frugiperda]
MSSGVNRLEGSQFDTKLVHIGVHSDVLNPRKREHYVSGLPNNGKTLLPSICDALNPISSKSAEADLIRKEIAVCNTVFASTRESNPTPAQPPASESNEPTSSRAPDSTRDSRQRARWARSSNRQ